MDSLPEKTGGSQDKTLRMGMGAKEPDTFPDATGAFHAMSDRAGTGYVDQESPETAHEWLTPRRDLREFAPLLFKD